jgi:hypothetical protein
LIVETAPSLLDTIVSFMADGAGHSHVATNWT